jgi:hypothetical protein
VNVDESRSIHAFLILGFKGKKDYSLDWGGTESIEVIGMFTKILIWLRSWMSAEEIDEEEEKRTTTLGLFNFAESYWAAAEALDNAKLKSTHPSSPVSFLYYHAIELYQKPSHDSTATRSLSFQAESSAIVRNDSASAQKNSASSSMMGTRRFCGWLRTPTL